MPRLVERMRAVLDSEEIALAVPVQHRDPVGSGAPRPATLAAAAGRIRVFVPTTETWHLVDDWIDRGARSIQHFGVMRLLIGALAAEQQATLSSLDRDFARMARLGLVDPHE